MDHTLRDDLGATIVDRVALRALVDTYARRVDGGDPDAVAELFTADGSLVSWLDGDDAPTPVERRGRARIAAALRAGLARYERTTHVVGGHVVSIDGGVATGDAVCLAHHVYAGAGGARRLLVMAVRYADRYERGHGGWAFARRELRLDWRQDRPLEE